MTTRIKIISAPSDTLKPPKGSMRRRFKVGDKVITPEGYRGTVERIEDGYRDRADVWHRRRIYWLNLPNAPGSPRIAFAGWELEREIP